jgi:hypothetical protein
MRPTSADRRSSRWIDGMNENLGPGRLKTWSIGERPAVATRRSGPAFRP